MFEVRLSRRAQRYYERVDRDTAARLDRALAGLKANPFAGGDVKRIRGRPGSFRLRVGDLRVLFTVNVAARVVEVAAIVPRGQAYR
jgi:mRNA interferase RelE/StbE